MLVTVLTPELLQTWLRARYVSARVRDGGHVFWVDTPAEAGPLLVVKATGAAWRLGAEPAKRAVFGMPSPAMFARAMRAAGLDPGLPHDRVPLEPPPPLPPSAPAPATLDEVAAWLRAEFGWRHIEDRISDLGWAYSVNTQTDAFLDTGDPFQGTVGNGPTIVVKRTRGVWFFGSNPVLLPATTATNEAGFYAARKAVFRHSDPHRPDRLLPPGHGDCSGIGVSGPTPG